MWSGGIASTCRSSAETNRGRRFAKYKKQLDKDTEINLLHPGHRTVPGNMYIYREYTCITAQGRAKNRAVKHTEII